MKRIVFITFAIIVIVSLSIYLVKHKKTPSTITTTLPQVSLTIDIPENWQKEENNNQVSFYSPESQQQKTADITKGCKVTTLTTENTEGLTTDSLSNKLEEQFKEDNLQPINKYIKKTTIDNKEAVDSYIETAEFGVVRKFYIFSDNQIKQLILYAKDDKKMCQIQFEQMIKNGKF